MKHKPTKLSIALAYLQANPGATAYEAAKHARMLPTNLYAYQKRRKLVEQGICPTCGQVKKPRV